MSEAQKRQQEEEMQTGPTEIKRQIYKAWTLRSKYSLPEFDFKMDDSAKLALDLAKQVDPDDKVLAARYEAAARFAMQLACYNHLERSGCLLGLLGRFLTIKNNFSPQIRGLKKLS